MRKPQIRLLSLMLMLLLIPGCAARQQAQSEPTPLPADEPDNQTEHAKADFRIDTVKTGAFSMDYLCFGHGKQPLVILPGISVQRVMGAAEAVAEAYAPLTDAFTIYLFERRNDLPAVYTIYDMARDTAEALQALKLGPVCMLGVSQGGMIAMDIAIEYPELVQKLVLGSTAARVTEEQLGAVGHWIDLAKDGDAEALYLAFGEDVYPPDVFEQSRDLLISAAQTVTDEDLDRFVVLAEGMRGFDVLDKLDKIVCPVLVIGSQDDQVLGAAASLEITERLRDCAVYLYDGYGHAAYDTAPDYKERLLQFFAPDAAN